MAKHAQDALLIHSRRARFEHDEPRTPISHRETRSQSVIPRIGRPGDCSLVTLRYCAREDAISSKDSQLTNLRIV